MLGGTYGSGGVGWLPGMSKFSVFRMGVTGGRGRARIENAGHGAATGCQMVCIDASWFLMTPSTFPEKLGAYGWQVPVQLVWVHNSQE